MILLIVPVDGNNALFAFLTPEKLTWVRSNWPRNIWEDLQRQLEMKLHGGEKI